MFADIFFNNNKNNMDNILSNLEPKIVWSHFEDICKIPRPSKKEEKIIEYLINFGKKLNLETKRDEAGNVLIRKPASKGKENVSTVVLQSHMDMVCEKNNDVVHDFDNDPIIPYIDGNWVKAKGTTLGADDGIGVAMELAILSDDNIKHGPIECLFTVDEETGLTGAFALKPGFLNGKILINLDSEDEGEIFVGCAGGIDTVATLTYKTEDIPENVLAYKIIVNGLKGGHSGDEINKGLGNSIKILNRLLWNANEKFNISIAAFDGGNLRNAIPREASAIITISPEYKSDLNNFINESFLIIKEELSKTEPNINIFIEETELPEYIIDKNTRDKLLNVLYACPHGVISMSKKMKGMVETSTNLASVKFIDNNKILITTSQRSDSNTLKIDVASMVESTFKLAGATVEHSDGYPGWTPNPDSAILKTAVNTYKKLFNVNPVVRSIHAGLECGLFLEKYPDMDMISIGPTLKSVHSPDERIDITTVKKFWDMLLDILDTVS